jgi:hypothetical protein
MIDGMPYSDILGFEGSPGRTEIPGNC